MEAIEKELKIYNSENRRIIMNHSIYLEPDPETPGAPNERAIQLLEHLIQWETVFDLKYEHKVYDGPVYAGIDLFGANEFPQGVDKYFTDKMRDLRQELHDRRRTRRDGVTTRTSK